MTNPRNNAGGDDGLWAKSQPSNGRPARTLIEHTLDVLGASRAIFGTHESPRRLCDVWSRFFKLDQTASFLTNLELAVLLHDLGKANNDFQATVRGSSLGQSIRHEHLGALCLMRPEVEAWACSGPEAIDFEIVLSAVLCHHLKAAEGDIRNAMCGESVRLSVDHPDFSDLLGVIEQEAGLTASRPTFPSLWTTAENRQGVNARKSAKDLVERLLDFEDVIDFEDRDAQSEPRMRLLWAVRSALVVCDAVGSAMLRTGTDLGKWVSAVTNDEALCDTDWITKHVIAPRIEQLGDRWRDWSPFQTRTGELPERALLLAACGSGKTLAAWKWIANHCAGGRRHVLFLYPTRATATEGFRDYVSWAPETDAALMHGAAGYELDGMFTTPDDADFRSRHDYGVDRRLYALGYWGKRVFSATVDQFLSFMQHQYGAGCLLPVLADSVVVVDEVHSFDASMFSTLEKLLQEFDLPVLCMTASLPVQRRDRLTNAGLILLDAYDGEDGTLKTITEANRYRVRFGSRDEAQCACDKALADGRKVLWVVNTVARAQSLAEQFARSIHDAELMTDSGVPVYCYHSRYRLGDRQTLHRQTVTAFQQTCTTPVLGITTQVCEMGLDLDADLLITERAPITSLIQRMGRCNRAATPRSGAGDVFLYDPGEPLPYDEDHDLSGVDAFTATLTSRDWTTQADLEAELQVADAAFRTELPRLCPFVAGGPFASGKGEEFRNIEAFTGTGVLSTDIAAVIDAATHGEPTDGFQIPIPLSDKTPQPDPWPKGLPKWLRVGSARHYLPTIGYTNRLINPSESLPPCRQQPSPTL